MHIIINIGRGVDMILDCIGSSYWEKNARSIAVDGTWVLYGLISKFTQQKYLAMSATLKTKKFEVI